MARKTKQELEQEAEEERVAWTTNMFQHITKLQVFDTPKNLCDFWNTKKGVFCQPITRAPQSYCFVEVEE